MYQILFTNKMKRDVKRIKKRGKKISKLVDVLDLLSTGKPLESKYRDHQLSGNMSDFRECHIEPDWLLVYRIEDDRLIIIATETGTHSDLFSM